MERYRNSITHWEIWNEPDNPQFWKPAPDPIAYARVLSATSAEISLVAPEANILLGGINPYDTAFLRTIAEAGAWWSFDILNIHPYVDPATPEDNGGMAGTAMANMQSVMNWAGQKPVWVTEYGWSARPSDRDPAGSTTEDEQASYLVRGAALLRAAGVQRILWYSIKDEVHNGYGLLRFASNYDDYNDPRPALTAFRVLNQRLTGATFERYRYDFQVVGEHGNTGQQNVYVLRFVRGGETIDVVWSLVPGVILLTADQPQARLFNRDGFDWTVQAEGNRLRLYVGQTPLYVVQPR
ncbi:MAG: hypothetical protein HC893_01475 [Chloroflexaceae bacterium]|nr:hypothetical protein [Chloroflexaceae bacterium]